MGLPGEVNTAEREPATGRNEEGQLVRGPEVEA